MKAFRCSNNLPYNNTINSDSNMTTSKNCSKIVLSQANCPELVATVRDLFREYAEAIGTNLEYQGFTAELAALPVPYVPPSGALLIAHIDDDVAGCVGLTTEAGGWASDSSRQ